MRNCGYPLALRRSASAQGSTDRFASPLVVEREIIRTQLSESRSGLLSPEAIRAQTYIEQRVTKQKFWPVQMVFERVRPCKCRVFAFWRDRFWCIR